MIVVYFVFRLHTKNPEAYNETMQTAWPMHDMPKDGAKIQSLSIFLCTSLTHCLHQPLCVKGEIIML